MSIDAEAVIISPSRTTQNQEGGPFYGGRKACKSRGLMQPASSGCLSIVSIIL